MDVKGLEKVLKQKEAEQAKAEVVLAKAWAARRQAMEKIRAAEEDLLRLQAAQREGADAESWTFRRQWKAAEEALAKAKGEDARAAAAVTAAQQALDPVLDEVLALREQLAGPRLEALREKVGGLWAKYREAHGAAVAAARELVGLHCDAVAAAPPRVVLKRAAGRFLLVAPRDPALREACAARWKLPKIPPGFFHLEYFKAMRESGEGGKFELLQGQDLTPPPPEEVEVTWGTPPLPEEIAAIEHIDLGIPIESSNGTGAPKGRGSRGKAPGIRLVPQRRVTFHELAHEVETARKEATHEDFVG